MSYTSPLRAHFFIDFTLQNKENNPSFHWNIKDTVMEHKVTKAEVSQNLTWISNLNKRINILFEAVLHICWGVFQVHLFVAQIISVAKSILELHGANMKGGKSAQSEWLSLIDALKEFCFLVRYQHEVLFHFFPLKTRGRLLSQTIASAKPLLRQQDTYHSASGNVTCPNPSAWLMTAENRKPVMQSPVPESWLWQQCL